MTEKPHRSPEKQKVTLYIPPELHRQLKIKAAVDAESMSAVVEKAIGFYLQHPEAVEAIDPPHGTTHRIYTCPSCESSLVIRDGEAIVVGGHPAILAGELPTESMPKAVELGKTSEGEEELVPC